MDLALGGRARQRKTVVAAFFVAAGLLLLGGIVALTAVDREGPVLEGVTPEAALRGAPAKIDAKRLRASFTFGTGGALEVQVQQVGVFDPVAQRADVTITGLGAGNVRAVADGPELYVQGARPFGVKPWGKLSAAEAGPLGSGVGQVSGGLIQSVVRILDAVPAPVDRGIEKVAGRRVRHIAGTVSTGTLNAISPLFAQLGAAGDATVDAYLDNDGVPRQVDITADASATKVRLGVSIVEIGAPEAVQLPPPAEVADVTLRDLATVLRA